MPVPPAPASQSKRPLDPLVAASQVTKIALPARPPLIEEIGGANPALEAASRSTNIPLPSAPATPR
jgi:hypothetical protein